MTNPQDSTTSTSTADNSAAENAPIERLHDAYSDINVLVNSHAMDAAQTQWPTILKEHGVESAHVHVEIVSLSCEPDNMLVTEYEMKNGTPPITESLHRVVVNARTALSDAEMTRAVVACLPEGASWYGTSGHGHITPSVTAACNVRF